MRSYSRWLRIENGDACMGLRLASVQPTTSDGFSNVTQDASRHRRHTGRGIRWEESCIGRDQYVNWAIEHVNMERSGGVG